MEKLKYFCCICMNRREQLCSLSDVDSDNVKYLTKLSFCVPKETWGEFYQICNSCIDQLNTAYTFLKVCLESEQFRKEQLEDKNPETDLQLAENTKEIQFTCDHCNKSFKQKKYLCQHITKLHVKKQRKENIQKSNEEEIKIEDNNDIKVEVELDNAKKNLNNLELSLADNECPLKSESDDEDSDNYFDKSYLSENEEIDDKPTKFKSVKKKKRYVRCAFCPLTFLRGTEWKEHIRTEHTSEKPFSCDQCEARYMNSYSLLIHKRKHTNEKPFVCPICGKSFISSANLIGHNKIHNSDRAYSCPICDRSFKTHSNLRTHRLQVHLDPSEWKFLCHLCNKKFPIRSTLVKHLKRHAGVKEFDCKICGKKFIDNAELKLHFQTHSKQKPLKCKLCSKEYKHREGLRRHSKVIHGEGNWKPPKMSVACPLCPKVFETNNKLQRHIYTHTGEKPYKCDYCQKGFIDNYGRKVHYKKDHNLELCD